MTCWDGILTWNFVLEILFLFSDQMGVNRSFYKCISIKKWEEVLVPLFFKKSAPTIAAIFGPFVANLCLFLPEPQPGESILIYQRYC